MTLGAQIGGKDAFEKTHSSVVLLRRLLGEFCVGPYSTEIDEFAPVIRIDGKIQQFGFKGLKNLRRSKKDRYITVDVGFVKEDWSHHDELAFRKVLLERVQAAIDAFLKRLSHDRVFVDQEALLNDLSEVKASYLCLDGTDAV